MNGPKEQAFYDAMERRNNLNRKIQTRYGRIAVLGHEIVPLEAERNEINGRLLTLEKEAREERFGKAVD